MLVLLIAALLLSNTNIGNEASMCTGNAILYAEPILTTVKSPIAFHTEGLLGCANSQMAIKTNDCDGQEVARIYCKSPACSERTTYATSVGGNYKFVACLAENGGRFIGLGRQAFAIVDVIDKPDLLISGITMPKRIEQNVDFRPTIGISTSGHRNAIDTEYKYEISGPQNYYRSASKEFKITLGNSETRELGAFALPKGSYTLSVSIDPNNKIDELNELNNIKRVEFEAI